MSVTHNSKLHYRTWVEIDRRAAARNILTFRKLIGPKVKLWAVVKSNAYGHGLVVFSKLAEEYGVDGFCVDSCVEGLRLRREKIRKPILVLGPTLQPFLGEAAAARLTVTVANFDMLRALARHKNPPSFHVKMDTGMHRQGFYLEDVPGIIKKIGNPSSPLGRAFTGIYTHFASAKDINYPTYTDVQLQKFHTAVWRFERAGFKNLMKHCANSGATLINKKYHLDAVRVGISLYGLWPSKELEMQLRRPEGGRSSDLKASGLPRVQLHPVLSWRTVVSEIKNLKAGDYVGYDLTERMLRPTKLAVLPIGYWHGFPRTLSGSGEVLVRGKRAKVLGRVSMDMTTVDVTRTGARGGDRVTLIGRDGEAEILAFDLAQKIGTIHYELLTRLNPLMERVVV